MTLHETCNLKTLAGWMRVEALADALTSVTFTPQPERVSEPGSPLLREAVRQLQAYFDGALSAFSLPLAWTQVEGFRKEILQMVAGIPYGELATYGGLAERAGKPGAARAVGSAVGSNPWLIVVPCHRVIGSDCRLHGFSALGGLEMKTWLLRHEGHQIIAGKVNPPRS